jgi:hypothetical protein
MAMKILHRNSLPASQEFSTRSALFAAGSAL